MTLNATEMSFLNLLTASELAHGTTSRDVWTQATCAGNILPFLQTQNQLLKLCDLQSVKNVIDYNLINIATKVRIT